VHGISSPAASASGAMTTTASRASSTGSGSSATRIFGPARSPRIATGLPSSSAADRTHSTVCR
jgi:hypothetical protein